MAIWLFWCAVKPEGGNVTLYGQIFLGLVVFAQLFMQWKKSREDRIARREQHEMDMVHRQQLHEEQKEVLKKGLEVIEERVNVNTDITAKAAVNGNPEKAKEIAQELHRYNDLRRVADIETGDPAPAGSAAEGQSHEVSRSGRVLQPHHRGSAKKDV